MVEQITVPDDSTDFQLKRKRGAGGVVNSGLITTGITNKNAISGLKSKIKEVIFEDEDDLCFSNRGKDKNKNAKQQNLLNLMSNQDFDNIKDNIEAGF